MNNSIQKQLNQFLPMLKKATWKCSKKYSLDYDDLEGQAFLIFCEAIQTHNENIGSFSTHLTNQLNRLEHYCKKEFRKKYKDILRIKKENKRGYGKNIFTNRAEISENHYYEIFDKVITKIDYEVSLSNDAKEIVKYICSRCWEKTREGKSPRFSHIQKVYLSKGWARNRIIKSWNEVKLWWQGSNKDQFCLDSN